MELETILKVCEKLSKRFKYSYHEPEDIYQDLYIICNSLLEKWDGQRSLENFLTIAASNAIRTEIKKQIGSANPNIKKTKQNIDKMSNIDDLDVNGTPSYNFEESLIDHRLICETIADELPAHLRKNYMKFKANIKLPNNQKVELINAMREIYAQEYLPRASTVNKFSDNVEKIPFSSGILGKDEYGYMVIYDI